VRIAIVEANPTWPARFAAEARRIRADLGDWAVRIDHIGSTAVAGLAAKDVLDIQVTAVDAAELDDPRHPGRVALESRGYRWQPNNPDRRKRFFRGPTRASGDDTATAGDVNLHVRRDGCVSQQQALLLRDYLRAEPSARRRYENVKRSLTQQDWPTVDDYAQAKGDVVWELLREADRWSWSGWRPGPADA